MAFNANSFKAFFSRNAASLALGFASLMSAIAATPFIAWFVKHIIRRELKNIRTNVNLYRKNQEFISLLTSLIGENKIAEYICEPIAKDSTLLFREAGRDLEKNSRGDTRSERFTNATINPEFKKILTGLPGKVEGWKDRSILSSVILLKDSILEDSFKYLQRKNYLKKESYRPGDTDPFSEPEQSSTSPSQMDLGIATMVAFLNIFLKIYERFITLISSEGEMKVLDVDPESVLKTFSEVVSNFVRRSVIIMEEGDSKLLTWIRAKSGKRSKRAESLLATLENISGPQQELALSMNLARDKKKLSSLLQSLEISGFSASERYMKNIFSSLLVESASLSIDDSWSYKDENKSVLDFLLSKTEDLYEKPISIYGLTEPVKFSDMQKRDSDYYVSDNSIMRISDMLYLLSVYQILSNSLSASLKGMLSDGESRSKTNPMILLFTSLLERSQNSSCRIMEDILESEYYSAWSKRHTMLCQDKAVSVSIDLKNMDVYLDTHNPQESREAIKDPFLQALLEKINALPYTYAQSGMRKMIGVLHRQKRLLDAFKDAPDTSSEAEEDIQQSFDYTHLSRKDKDLLDLSVFMLLLDCNEISGFQNTFSQKVNGITKDSFLSNHPILKDRLSSIASMRHQVKKVVSQIERYMNQSLTTLGSSVEIDTASIEEKLSKIRSFHYYYNVSFSRKDPDSPYQAEFSINMSNLRISGDYRKARESLRKFVATMSEVEASHEVKISDETAYSLFNWARKKTVTRVVRLFLNMGEFNDRIGLLKDSVTPRAIRSGSAPYTKNTKPENQEPAKASGGMKHPIKKRYDVVATPIKPKKKHRSIKPPKLVPVVSKKEASMIRDLKALEKMRKKDVNDVEINRRVQVIREKIKTLRSAPPVPSILVSRVKGGSILSLPKAPPPPPRRASLTSTPN